MCFVLITLVCVFYEISIKEDNVHWTISLMLMSGYFVLGDQLSYSRNLKSMQLKNLNKLLFPILSYIHFTCKTTIIVLIASCLKSLSCTLLSII